MKIVDQIYRCADFSQVTFDWHNEQATTPHWIAIAPETVQP